LGNILSVSLQRDTDVAFAAYTVPTEIDNKLIIKVITTTNVEAGANSDHLDPITVIDEHVGILTCELDTLKNSFLQALHRHYMKRSLKNQLSCSPPPPCN